MPISYSQPLSSLELIERYDIAVSHGTSFAKRFQPGDPVPMVFRDADELRKLRAARWGLRGAWPQTLQTHCPVETLIDRPPWQPYLKTHRCLWPADAFFFWRLENGQRVLYRCARRDGALFGLGALLNLNARPLGGYELAGALLTTPPHPGADPCALRMPLMLSQEQESIWLNPHSPLHQILFCLAPCPPDLLQWTAIDRQAGSAKPMAA